MIDRRISKPKLAIVIISEIELAMRDSLPMARDVKETISQLLANTVRLFILNKA